MHGGYIMDDPRVLIVILNYKTYEMTLDLIVQLKEISYKNFDIIVIDNNSPNESGKILEEKKAEMGYFFIKNPSNSGYAFGNNLGIRFGVKQGYKYSLILNNDVKITDSMFLNKLVSAIESESDLGCVGPKVFDLDDNIVPPHIKRLGFFDMTFGIGLNRKKRKECVDTECYVYRIFGCCVLLKNSVMEEINYFDERTFLYFEEDILAEKLLNKEYKSKYIPEAEILHMDSVTVKKEQGAISWVRIKTVLNSMDIYLKDYRGFGCVKRLLCKAVRAMVLIFKH